MIEYLKALQKQIEVGTIVCYHNWDKLTGICSKCGHINFSIAEKNLNKK